VPSFNDDTSDGGTATAVPDHQLRNLIFPIIFILCSVTALFFALQGWQGSLMELHSFRQTQTAITVKYFLKGGNFLSYETPVLGPPWSIPMEFPLYQYVVYLLVLLTGYGLEQAGRLVSLAMFVSLFYPVFVLVRPYFPNRSRTFIILALLAMSPQYLYWSRTFMIESTALTLALWYLYFIRTYLEQDDAAHGQWRILAIMFIGSAAAVTKITTFFVYYVIAGLYLLVWLSRSESRSGAPLMSARKLSLLVASLVIPPLAAIAWIRYSDYVKSLNPLGNSLTSANLCTWNFGTLDQKMAKETWYMILGRAIPDLFGDFNLVSVGFLLLWFCRRQTVGMVLTLFMLYLLPIAVFTNLYVVHNYYGYANGILLLIAVALIIGDLSVRGLPGYVVAFCLLALILADASWHYITHYLPSQGARFPYQLMKAEVDAHTKPDDVLVIYGPDWSSAMPYYLDRRALMFTNGLNTQGYRQAVANVRQYSIGGVLFCGGTGSAAGEQTKMLESLQLSAETLTLQPGMCDAYFPNKED
jgi:hypothetical protein